MTNREVPGLAAGVATNWKCPMDGCLEEMEDEPLPIPYCSQHRGVQMVPVEAENGGSQATFDSV